MVVGSVSVRDLILVEFHEDVTVVCESLGNLIDEFWDLKRT